MKKRQSVRRAWVSMIAGLALLAAGCRRASQTAEGGKAVAAAEVRLAAVVRRPVERTIDLSGTLHGREEATLSAKVGGRVIEVVRDVDDIAQGGDIVIQLDRTDYELTVAEREAALKAALAKVGLAEIPGPEFDVARVPTVQRSKAEAVNAEAKLKRARVLFEERPPVVSEQEYADAKTQAEVANRSAEIDLLIAQTSLAEARTQSSMIASAVQRLNDTAIRAPSPATGEAIQYRIAERLVSLGELVAAGQPVARIVATDSLKFRGQVPERFAGRIVKGQRAYVTVDAFPERFPGVVERVAPRIDPSTRTFEVEIEIANASGALKPGGFSKTSIVVGREENVPFVPKSAVATFAGVRRIFSVRDGKAAEHQVVLGGEQDGLVEIVGGTEVGEVVVGGVNNLTQGRPVRIVQEAGAAK